MKAFFIDIPSGSSGWGIAKVGTVTLDYSSDGGISYASADVDVSDLGFSSVDDYTVNLVLVDGSDNHDGSVWPRLRGVTVENRFKTKNSFRVGADRFASSITKSVFSYVVIAKGYGGSGGGGGQQ